MSRSSLLSLIYASEFHVGACPTPLRDVHLPKNITAGAATQTAATVIGPLGKLTFSQFALPLRFSGHRPSPLTSFFSFCVTIPDVKASHISCLSALTVNTICLAALAIVYGQGSQHSGINWSAKQHRDANTQV